MTILNFERAPTKPAEGQSISEAPSGVLENWNAAFKGARAQQPLAERRYERQYWSTVLDEIEAQTGESFNNPMAFDLMRGSYYDHYLGKIQNYVRANKDKLEGDFDLLLSPNVTEDIAKQSRERALNDIQESEEIYSRSSGALSTAASFAGAFAAEATDTTNLALAIGTSPIAAGARSWGGIMLREALLNAGSEALLQPAVAQWYGELGLDYSFETFRDAVLLAGATGAGFAGAIKLGGRTITLTKEQLKKGYDAFIGSGASKETDVGVGASMMYDDAVATEANNPLDGANAANEHVDRVSKAQKAIEQNELSLVPGDPQSAVVPPKTVYDFDNLDNQIYRFDPKTIQVDAQTFQFKSGGDEYGVTERLKDVTVWDPSLSGQVTVYEYVDGSRFIADGHQRLGLAKRIMDQDPSQDVRLYGSLLREVDGITPEEAMVTAAFKNIGEGTGTVLDAAKIFRFAPERVDDPRLPKRSAFVRQARSIANLSDNSFGLVVNEIVRPDIAAVVGRMIPADKEMQDVAMDVLAKTDPSSQFQAETIVGQVLSTGVSRETQVSLFGEEEVLESLFLERAKILERSKNQLKKDQAAFKNLVKNADRIEGEGNQLAKDANEKRTQQDGTAIALLQSQANRKGALSDALSEAARFAKSTGRYGEATKSFVDAIRRAINEGDFERAEISDVGRYVDDTPQATTIRDQHDEATLDMFDDPHGEAVKQQADAVTEDIRADLTEPKLLREDLKRLVESGAPEEQIVNHPSILRALDEMQSIEPTTNRAGYDTDAWYETRRYNIGARRDGTFEEVHNHLVDVARKLGWEDAGLEFPKNAIRQERKAVIILGPPAAGKSTIANPIARKIGGAIVDADEAKKVLPEYNDGIGANAVHEESSTLNELVFQDLMEQGDNIVLPKVGGKPKSIETAIARLKENGYEVDIVDMVVGPEEAMRRMVARFISTGRLIPPNYVRSVGTGPSATYDFLKQKGAADGYTRIFNEVGRDDAKPIIEDTRNLLDNVELRLRRSGDEGDRAGAGGGSAESIASRAEAAEPVELPLIEESLLDAEFPIEQMLDADDNMVARTVTAREILAEIDQDDAMIDRLSRCPL
jgi:predicted kinase